MKALNYSIKWSYRHIPVITYCAIYENELPFAIGEGSAVCSRNDLFCKNTGRKISLARAMKNANMTKNTRASIWEAYRNTKKGGRW